MIPIISVVGKSNTGKTTLLEKLIPELNRRGYRIGVIKHDAHDFEIDHEGKDTWRLTRAGAETVVISAAKKLAMIRTAGPEPLPATLDELASRLFFGMDLIITEGYKRESKPKIEVTRTGKLLCTDGDHLLAVAVNPCDGAAHGRASATDGTGGSLAAAANPASRVPESGVPWFSADDPVPLADLIEKKFLAGD